ncbi:MAG: MBL fold metallo-hydrolase [Pseudohongiella sp.]|uniref:MBL fold metallo-hydrolase n=1 Tax=Pseudohongiella sp. TaxID=1979412 RepID=UPI0034A00559
MKPSLRIPMQMLGQSGCLLRFPDTTLYVDPYLSNSVQLMDAPDLVRQIPLTLMPEQVVDADWVLLTHAHIDHCDPHTIPALSLAAPQARFIGPEPVLGELRKWSIEEQRLHLAEEQWQTLSETLRVKAIPAAHPEIERDAAGRLACVGFLLEYQGQRIYIAGDTSARQEVIDALLAEGPVHTAFLPVNEHNFFKGQRGIIGNMSVREAFQLATEIGACQVVAVHWDMFAANAVDPDEIRAVYRSMNSSFKLLLKPSVLNMGPVHASVVIRTLNEAKHLDDLLKSVASQQTTGLGVEVVLVDSGSTDGTLGIAERHGCRIHHIKREEFSFGRSLNIGCEAALGDILIIISGHCVPTGPHWLQRLCQPILDDQVDYSYGRQLGGGQSYFSECRTFAKYFPERSCIPQQGFFCNNANSALSKSAWEKYRFNEDLTGLEDMELAQRLVRDGSKVGYVGDATVFHYHDESWVQVRRRFEREAIALQKIMPQIHVNLFDTLRYIASSVLRDWRAAKREGRRAARLGNILRYRWHQYMGAWKGNRQHRLLSHTDKEKYYYPE